MVIPIWFISRCALYTFCTTCYRTPCTARPLKVLTIIEVYASEVHVKVMCDANNYVCTVLHQTWAYNYNDEHQYKLRRLIQEYYTHSMQGIKEAILAVPIYCCIIVDKARWNWKSCIGDRKEIIISDNLQPQRSTTAILLSTLHTQYVLHWRVL